MILSRPKRVLYHDFIVTASKIYQHFISIYWAIFLFIRGGVSVVPPLHLLVFALQTFFRALNAGWEHSVRFDLVLELKRIDELGPERRQYCTAVYLSPVH